MNVDTLGDTVYRFCNRYKGMHLNTLIGKAPFHRLRTWALLACMLGTFAPACSPMASTSAIREASAQLEVAEQSRADKYAPYLYYSAKHFLTKAKLTEGYSEFGAAEEYARRAKDLANRSAVEARENRLRQKILNQRLKQRDKVRRGK